MKPRQLVQGLQRLLPPASEGAVVLAYHLVAGGTRSPVDIPLDAFKRQLDVLAEHDVISLDELLRRVARGSVGPSVVLTFDDAYLNFFEVAWPELSARQLPCTLYAPVAFVSGRAPAPIRGTALRACSWDQLRQLANDGVQIGSHGVDHLNLRRADASQLERELCESRATLEAELGRPVTSFCYPQAKYGTRALEATRAHYQSAVVAGGTRAGSGLDPHRIPRFPVRRDEAAFDLMLSSAVWLAEAAADRLRQLRA